MFFLLSVNYMWVQNPQRLFKGWEAHVLPENCENAKHTEHESVLHGCHEVQRDRVWTSAWRSLRKFLIVHQSCCRNVHRWNAHIFAPLLICTENALMFYSHSQHAICSNLYNDVEPHNEMSSHIQKFLYLNLNALSSEVNIFFKH